MNVTDTNAILNRLLILHNRSLPTYLSYAVPWVERGNDSARETLDLIVDGHRSTVERVGKMILDSGGSVATGEFPLRYAAYHDLSFEFLRKRMIEYEEQMIDAISRYVEQLRPSPTAQAVALEAMGEAKAHLQSLRELAERPAEATGA
jgi:hypothetical protein